MTNTELCDLAYKMATDYFGYSKYRKDDTATNYGWEYNVGKWEDNRWHSDCLGFVHIAVNGFKGDRSVLGGGAVMDDFVLMSDEWTTLNKYCPERGQFPKADLKKGALLQNSGHVGLYIGDVAWNGLEYNTAECTLALRKGWLLTWTDLETGYRYSYKGGIRLSSGWQNWGYFDRVEYVEEKEPVEHKTFTDVHEGMNGYKAITWMADNGYIYGYKDGTFRPKENLTREQLCVILWRMAGKPE